MSTALSQNQVPKKRHIFKLEGDDSYVGICGEIYITKKLYVVFHCGLCKEEYGELKRYLRHISRHYANCSQWIDSTAGTALDTEHTRTPSASEGDPLIESATEDVDYLMEEAVKAEEMDDDAVKVLAEKIEETAELATNAVEEPRGTNIEDIKIEDGIKVGRDDVESRIIDNLTPYTDFLHDNGHSLHSKQAAVTCNRMLRKCLKRPHANASPTKGRNCDRLIRVHTRLKSVTTAYKDVKKLPNDAEYERKFKCYICGFAFKVLSNLRAHMRRHTDQKPYSCTMCPKQFYTSTELTFHQRRHTGERPFTCEQCGLCFISASSMHNHQKRHSNRRPHKCPQCNKCFYDSYLLKKHFVTHTGERNFVCETCNASFTRRRSLLAHMKLHANLKEYVCSICQQGFNQRPGLTSHIKSKHKVVA